MADIMIVEDESSIRQVLGMHLMLVGHRVREAQDAACARALIAEKAPDLALLDIMMPGEDGFSLTRWVRERADTPVLILTARGMAGDRIEGLTIGADDYLQKPFDPQELLLRIEAILRRTGAKPRPGGRVQLGRCAFDLDRGELFRDEALVRLTEAETQLMRRLANSPHAAVDRLDLARDTADITGRAVDVQVTRLRRKIEDDPKAPRYLQTVRGVGYMLAPD